MRWPPSPGLLSLITLREANHIYITAGSLDLELKELKKLHVQCVPSTWVSWPWIAIIMWNMCQWYDAQDTVTRLTRLQFPCFTAGTDSQCCAAHQNQPTAGRLQLRWRHPGSAIYQLPKSCKCFTVEIRRVQEICGFKGVILWKLNSSMVLDQFYSLISLYIFAPDHRTTTFATYPESRPASRSGPSRRSYTLSLQWPPSPQKRRLFTVWCRLVLSGKSELSTANLKILKELSMKSTKLVITKFS